jgi:hypothetical protein
MSSEDEAKQLVSVARSPGIQALMRVGLRAKHPVLRGRYLSSRRELREAQLRESFSFKDFD